MPAQDNFWGELIVQLRGDRRMSQRSLSARARVNRSTLRRIEDGTADGSITMFERMLSELGYELDVLANESIARRDEIAREEAADPDKRSRSARTRLLTMDL